MLKKQDPAFLKEIRPLQAARLYCAGEPMDETSHQWMMDELGIPVIDHYWQTETGWAMLSLMPGVEKQDVQLGSPGFPVYGYDVRLFRDDGSESAAPTRRASSASCRRCRRAACPPCGATTSASCPPTSRCSRSRWLFLQLRLGHQGTTPATTRSSAAPTT